ncbi:MAG: hypothetical protein AAFV62_10450 [Pseudomonadota bacterium]
MTTIITRLLPSETAANALKMRLLEERVPKRAISVITAGSGESTASLTTRLTDAMVHESAAAAYAPAMGSGAAVLVVRATYKPLGVALMTRRMLAGVETVATNAAPEDYFMPDKPDRELPILEEHPRFLTVPPRAGETRTGTISDRYGFKLLSDRKERTSAMSGGGFMSQKFLPVPLLSSRKPRDGSVMSGGKHMSTMFWPMPLIKDMPRAMSTIPGGGPIFSSFMGWKTTSKR